MTTRSSLLAGLLAVCLASSVRAQCTTDDEAKAAEKSAKKAAQCNDRILRSGTGVTCTSLPPPACAGTLTVDAIALAYGPNNPPTGDAKGGDFSLQRRCQKQIGKGVVGFTKKLFLIIKGRTPEQAELIARRQVDKVVDKCDVVVAQAPSGVVVPQVGPQCAAAVGGPGDTVDAVALRDCLLGLMRTWVDRVVPSPEPLRPNIIVIVTDDQRADTTDATHSPAGAFIMPRTRAALLDAGVELTNAFITTPVCCPSRSSILSGQYAHRHGVYANSGMNGGADDFDDTDSIGTMLQATGYRTGFVGKYLNGYNGLWTDPAPPYVPPGWDEWHAFPGARYFDWELVRNGDGYDHVIESYGSAPEDYSTDVLREIAKDFVVDSVAQGEPFFLYFAPKNPHGPWQPAPRHDGMFDTIPPYRPPSFNETDVTDKPSWVQGLAQFNQNQIDQIDFRRRKQLEMVQSVDEAIGGNPTFGIVGLIETLDALGVRDDTIILYIGDNGFHWGEHRRAQGKLTPYEEAIRTPFLVRYPKLAPLERQESGAALNIDIASTLAELAGIGVPIVQDGVSLVRLLDGTATGWRTDHLTEGWPNTREWASVREAEWKYTELPVTPGDPDTTFELELYDLVNDPYELENVATDPQHATRVAQMALRLRELRPNWPLDSDGDVDLPEEDGEDD